MSRVVDDNHTVRDRILESALRLFVEKGFHGTSVPEIVASSGTSIGAVYHHFAGKEELAHVLHRKLVGQFVEMSEREVLTQQTAQARVRGYVSMMFRLTEEDPTFVSYLLHARPKSVVEDNLTVCSREGLEVTQRIVSDGKRSGEVRDADDRVLCGLISGTIIRLLDMRLDGILPCSLFDLANDTATVIWDGIKAA